MDAGSISLTLRRSPYKISNRQQLRFSQIPLFSAGLGRSHTPDGASHPCRHRPPPLRARLRSWPRRTKTEGQISLAHWKTAASAGVWCCCTAWQTQPRALARQQAPTETKIARSAGPGRPFSCIAARRLENVG